MKIPKVTKKKALVEKERDGGLSYLFMEAHLSIEEIEMLNQFEKSDTNGNMFWVHERKSEKEKTPEWKSIMIHNKK